MKAVVMKRYGGPEVLDFAEWPAPKPKPNEAVVRVRAASVNPIDWQIREGLLKWFMRAPVPGVLGCDLAGEVVEVGSAVTRFRAGDEVFAMMPHDWGAQAELVAVPEELLAKKPEKVTMEEAGSLGAVAVTAVHALRDIAHVKAGEHVLVNGASGGVGLFSVQVAKLLGAHVTAVCGTDGVEMVRRLGADEVVDYKKEDVTESSRRFDVVFDCIGNLPHTACKPLFARKDWVHVTTMAKPAAMIRSALNVILSGRVAFIIAKPTRERIEWIAEHLGKADLKTVIASVMPASDVRKAHELSKAGRTKGKIVLTFA